MSLTTWGRIRAEHREMRRTLRAVQAILWARLEGPPEDADDIERAYALVSQRLDSLGGNND